MKRIKNITVWLINQSWFFSALLFFGLLITGNIENKKDFFSILILCLVLWMIDILFLKRGITKLLNKVLTLYKRWMTDFDKKR
jgi:hypothetical protein